MAGLSISCIHSPWDRTVPDPTGRCCSIKLGTYLGLQAREALTRPVLFSSFLLVASQRICLRLVGSEFLVLHSGAGFSSDLGTPLRMLPFPPEG